MSRDIILGLIMLVLAYALTVYLAFWSRRMIDHIAPKKKGTLREILKEIKHGR